MPVVPRYTWRRFPPLGVAGGERGVQAVPALGTYATVETRLYPQMVQIAPPIRLRYPRSYGTTTAIVSGVPGARLVRKDAAILITVLGA